MTGRDPQIPGARLDDDEGTRGGEDALDRGAVGEVFDREPVGGDPVVLQVETAVTPVSDSRSV